MRKKLTKDEVIKLFNISHGDKYDYSLMIYNNYDEKIKIICKEHGSFEQSPNNHIKNHGCPYCTKNKKYTTNEFIIKSKEIFGEDRYDYSLTNYINSHTKVKIICKEHGQFEKSPNNHISKRQGCPYCNGSLGENRIGIYLDKNNILFQKEKTFNKCIDIKRLRFDFYLSEYNTCIEFDGKQHYIINHIFGNEDDFKSARKRDKIKNEYCKNNNIHLLRISYKNYNKIEEILTDYLLIKRTESGSDT